MRSYVGVFSPTRQNYTLTLDADNRSATPLLRPISVQGPWDASSIQAGGVFVQEPYSGASAREFEVAQWSMRGLSADRIGAASGLGATLRLEGNALHAEVFNRGNMLVRDVALIQGDQLWRAGDLAPGAHSSGELTRRANANLGMPLSYLIYGAEIDKNSAAGGQPLPIELQLRTRILDALFALGPLPRNSQPLLIGWADTDGIALSPGEQRAERQNVTMIFTTPQIIGDNQSLNLGQGWLSPRFENNQNNLCFGSQGSGVSLGNQPSVMRLTLPRDLADLQIDELNLLTATDGPWKPETTIELYDWAGRTWVAQPAKGRPLSISEPARYLNPGGQLRVRISTTLSQPDFACVYVDAKLKGSLP